MALSMPNRARGVRNKIHLGKKAVFFTLISIMIIIMFIFYFRIQIDIPMKQKTLVVKERVTSLNDFVRSFEQIYMPRALYAISHRALGSIALYLNDTNTNRLPADKIFSSNISSDFQSAVISGEMSNGDPLLGMGENTMLIWLEKLTNVSRKEMNIEIAFTVNGITLEQDYETGPWRARAQMDISYWVKSEGVANWTRNNTRINTTFEVSGFMDPYLAVMSDGVLNRMFNITNVTADRINDMDQFKSLVLGGAYIFENTTAPNFLYRFEGNLSNSSCCGIESFVIPEQVYPGAAGDADIYGVSNVDFEFWSEKCFNEKTLQQEHVLWNVTDIYEELGFFKLDSYHRYEVYPNIFYNTPDAMGYWEIKGFPGDVCGPP